MKDEDMEYKKINEEKDKNTTKKKDDKKDLNVNSIKHKIEGKVLDYIRENKMIDFKESVVVGVSGGSDSMCLLNILLDLSRKMELSLHVVHIHHGIRGMDADNDMAFVERFCKRRNISFSGFKFDVPRMAKEKGLSSEEAGRLLRYEAFREVASKYENCKIAVAHNEDDVAETVLFNLFRGSGIKGLTGIAPVRDEIIRPILCLNKSEILQYLSASNITYCTDATNLREEYTRNKIRLSVLPYIEENINEKAKEHIAECATILRETDEYMNSVSKDLFDKTVILEGNGLTETTFAEIKFSNDLFENNPHILVSRVIRMGIMTVVNTLKDISNTHIEDVIKLFSRETGKKINLPYGISATKTYDGILLRVDRKENVAIQVIIDGVGEYNIPGEKALLRVSREEFVNTKFTEKLYTKWVAYDILGDNLTLRTRKTGDYIVVDDLGSRKKIKDYFIDIKIPRHLRDKVLLIANGQEIVWVIGYRIGANYKIDEGTPIVTKLEYMKEL